MKKHVLILGDHALFTSGVAHQLRLISLALLKSGKFKVTQLGAAIKHNDYRPVQPEDFNGDWTIIPVDGFGTKELVRSIVRTERVDMILYMSDPRFYTWFHEIENEIRPQVPTVWYAIWDNYPAPKYNKAVWESTDLMVCISKLTYDAVGEVAPETPRLYVPHVVNTEVFKPLGAEAKREFRKKHFPKWNDDHFMCFWNNRNARRKMSGTVIWAWKHFLDQNNLHGKATLMMHTDPKDPNGQDLMRIMKDFSLDKGQVVISADKLTPEQLATLYNAADVSMNISDAEGFGLSVAESKACGVPVICTMTGGMKDQITDGTNWFGIGIQPSSQALIGSQDVPYIYEDRVSTQDVVDALYDLWNSPEQRAIMGLAAREDMLKRFNFDDFNQKWVEIMESVYEKHGSWPNRLYKTWELIEL